MAPRKTKKINYAEVFWPQWTAKNRAFLSEEAIVTDLILKIRSNRKSLLWWVLVEETDIVIFSKKNKDIVVRYYNLTSARNPYFKGSKEPPDEIQLRILNKVWKTLHAFDDQLNELGMASHDGGNT